MRHPRPLTLAAARVSRTRKLLALRHGTTSVELAFVAPFILMLVFGSIEFSRVMMIKQSLTNAAREGCRIATLPTTQDAADVDQEIRNYVRSVFQKSDEPSVVRVTVSPSSLQGLPAGTEITTTVEVSFEEVSWVAANWIGNAEVSGTAKMLRE